jgi:hypothetical protein
MSPLYFGRQALAALTLTLSAVMPATVLAQAKSLDQLLEQTRNTRAEEAKANAARVAKFQAEFSRSAGPRA